MKRAVLILVLCFLFLPAYSYATLSLGSLYNEEKEIYASLGNEVGLKYTFFNKGDEEFKLKVTYEALNEGTWRDLLEYEKRIYLKTEDSIDDDAVYLDLPPMTSNPVSAPDRQWVALDGGKNYAELKSVYLIVRVPSGDVHANPYRIKLVATAENAKENQSSANVGQQREYGVRIYNNATRVGLVDTLDTDGDGLTDSDEKKRYYTNPFKSDTDGDGITDKDEVERGSDPLDPNSPKKPVTRTGSFLGSIGDFFGLNSNEANGTYTQEDREPVKKDNAPLTTPAENRGTNEDNAITGKAPANNDKNSPAGLLTGGGSAGPVNIVTLVIIIVGAASIVGLMRAKVY